MIYKFEQFILESKKNPSDPDNSRIEAKYQGDVGTIEALDFTQAGQNDLIEFLFDGTRKMVPKHELTIVD